MQVSGWVGVVSGGSRVGMGFSKGLLQVDSMWCRDGLALLQSGFGLV